MNYAMRDAIALGIIFYILIQVIVPTFIRCAEVQSGNPTYSRRDYLITLNPIVGILFAVFKMLKTALKKD